MLKTVGASAIVGLAGCAAISDPSGSSGNGTTTPSTTTTNTSTAGSEGQTKTQTKTKTSKGGSAKTTVVADFEDFSKWKPLAQQAASSNQSYAGESSAKLHRKSGEPVIARDVNIDFEGYNPSLAFKMKANKVAVVEVRLDAPDPKNQLIFTEGVRPYPGRDWMRLDLGVSDVKGLPDLKKVSKVRIRIRGGGDGANFWVDDLRAVPSPDKPTVAFTFDDALASQYKKGFNILSKYDMPATMFTITDNVGDTGYVTLNQMKEMKSAGWEFGSHGKTSKRLIGLSRLTAEEEIVEAKKWLVDHGFKKGAQYFAYPYGKFDQQAKQFLGNYHDMAFRYLGTASAGSGYVTEPLTASRGNGADLEQAKRMVKLATLYNDLQIFTFHGIGTGGSLGISAKEFEELVAYVADQNVNVVTASQIDSQFRLDLE